MNLSDGVGAAVPGCSRGRMAELRRRNRSRLRAAGLVAALAGGALGGCGVSEQGVGSLALDPGRYVLYHCNDLVQRLNILTGRESELRNLMDKANEGPGGAVMGALSYRTEYETVLSDQKLVRRVAAEKKCQLGPPTFQSDQTIR